SRSLPTEAASPSALKDIASRASSASCTCCTAFSSRHRISSSDWQAALNASSARRCAARASISDLSAFCLSSRLQTSCSRCSLLASARLASSSSTRFCRPARATSRSATSTSA
ncbi:unnamed protein product, partial [Ectocarpus sp. 12 AP-2014]